MKFSFEEIKNVKSVEEILTFAKEKGVNMTEEEAALVLQCTEKGVELSDEELENVASGSGWWTSYDIWSRPEDVIYKFGLGQHVEAITSVGWLTEHVYTVGCVVIGREARLDRRFTNAYVPYYLLSSDDPEFNGSLIAEHDIEGGYRLIVGD